MRIGANTPGPLARRDDAHGPELEVGEDIGGRYVDGGLDPTGTGGTADRRTHQIRGDRHLPGVARRLLRDHRGREPKAHEGHRSAIHEPLHRFFQDLTLTNGLLPCGREFPAATSALCSSAVVTVPDGILGPMASTVTVAVACCDRHHPTLSETKDLADFNSSRAASIARMPG